MSIVHPERPEHKYDIDDETGAVRIPLAGRKRPGLFVLIDADDVPLVCDRTWYAVKTGKRETDRLYVVSSGREQSSKGMTYMHRVILGLTDPKTHADHLNHNGLDNRRCNLRICTNQQNIHHARKTHFPRSSVYKGVSWHIHKNKWIANIMHNGKVIHLGYFVDEKVAGHAYDAAAMEFYGEYACLNFPREGENG